TPRGGAGRRRPTRLTGARPTTRGIAAGRHGARRPAGGRHGSILPPAGTGPRQEGVAGALRRTSALPHQRTGRSWTGRGPGDYLVLSAVRGGGTRRRRRSGPR